MLKMGCNPAASKMASNIKMNQMFDIWNWVPERIFVPQCSILLKNQVSYCIVWFSGKKLLLVWGILILQGREHRRGDKVKICLGQLHPQQGWQVAWQRNQLVSSWHGKSWKVRMPLKILEALRLLQDIIGIFDLACSKVTPTWKLFCELEKGWKRQNAAGSQWGVDGQLQLCWWCSLGIDQRVHHFLDALCLPGNFTSIQVEVWRGMGHILSAFQATCTIKTHRSAMVSLSIWKPPYAALYMPWSSIHGLDDNKIKSSCRLFMSLISIEHYWTVWLVGSLKFWSVALYDLSIMNYLCGRPRQSKPLLCSLSFMTWVSPSPEWKSVEPQESGKSNQKDLAGVKTSLESSWIYSNPMHSMHINARYCKCQVIATESALLLCLDSADFTRSAKTESISFLGSTLHRLQNLLRSTPWPHRKSQEHFRQTVKRRLLSGNAKENPQILDDSCQLFFIFSFSRFSILAFALTKPSTLAGSKNESTLCRLNVKAERNASGSAGGCSYKIRLFLVKGNLDSPSKTSFNRCISCSCQGTYLPMLRYFIFIWCHFCDICGGRTLTPGRSKKYPHQWHRWIWHIDIYWPVALVSQQSLDHAWPAFDA